MGGSGGLGGPDYRLGLKANLKVKLALIATCVLLLAAVVGADGCQRGNARLCSTR